MQFSWSLVLRFLFVILLQGLIFQRISLGGPHFNYIAIFFYPVLLMLMPMKTSRALLLIIGFLLGFIIDMFYESPGVHMSACVFLAFIRPWILKLMEPRGGFPVNSNPTSHDFGIVWFMQYSGILLFTFLFFYFSVEVFTYSRFLEILLKTLSSFVVSFVAILLYVSIFNPKNCCAIHCFCGLS
jgi:rod shape-determining protein MreD